jgi:uridine phosphorylase
MTISKADLPTNKRGAIYHLNIMPNELADWVILVGDPERVCKVSKHLDSIKHKSHNREFICHTGNLGNMTISVLSTGIGSSNIDIVMNELNALANYDLSSLTPLQSKRKLNILRLGTTGVLQADLAIGDIIASQWAIGFDNLFDYYQMSDGENELLTSINTHLNDAPHVYYAAKSSIQLDNMFTSFAKPGITATCPGFYAPQQRQGALEPRYGDFLERLSEYQYDNLRVLNFEMETSAILQFGELLNHNCCSLSVAIANRARGTFCKTIEREVENLIVNTLDNLDTL